MGMASVMARRVSGMVYPPARSARAAADTMSASTAEGVIPVAPAGAAETAAPGRGLFGRFRQRLWTRQMGLVLASWVVGIAIWEYAGNHSNEYAFASASATFAALRDLASSGVLWEHTLISFRELTIAFAIGAVIGVVGGTFAGMSWSFKTVTENWVTVGLALPFAAVFPIFLVWFGLGESSKIALGIFASVMPVWGNTRVGIESVDRQLIEMARSFGGKRRHIVRSVVLPWALPNIIEGLRFGLTRAFLAVVVGEMLASRGGLGYLINVSGSTLRMDNLLAAVVVVTVITLAMVHVMTLVRRAAVPWWDRKDG
jgi:ABC-type nitrate/sulfonate/bicarbonate transport system permease component